VTLHEETTMTVQDAQDIREETPVSVSRDPSAHGSGDPRVMLATRLLAAAALLVTAYIHGKLALHLGVRSPMLGQGQLFAAQAALCAVLAGAVLSRNSRVWLVAVVLSVAGLVAILASVYFPVPSLGPLPAIDEPVWLLNKAICAVAELTVITLWLIRQIAPPK
jgi:hypothetical protein